MILKQLIIEETDKEILMKKEAIEIFKSAFGQKVLEGHKFFFNKIEIIDGQVQVWFRVNPIEVAYSKAMKSGSMPDVSVIMSQLLQRLKRKVKDPWVAIVRSFPGHQGISDNFIILVREE